MSKSSSNADREVEAAVGQDVHFAALENRDLG